MAWSKEMIVKVWEKAFTVNGCDANEYRKDFTGAWIKFDQYGKTTNEFGWEIDHQNPIANGGSDLLGNLIPLQWENNRTKGDDYPKFKTSISSEGKKNVMKTIFWKLEN